MNIYLSGGMGLFGADRFDEGNSWRVYLTDKFSETEAKTFNPNDYFNFKDKMDYDSELEVMKHDLYFLNRSDLVIVNFNDPRSLGTTSELAIAYDHNIPIIGLNAEHNELHPWLECFCNRIFDDIDELADYVIRMYL